MEHQEHNYTSKLEEFLPWHMWVFMNCTQEEIDAWNSTEFSTIKNDLYERWLVDQQITSYTRIVDGKIVQYQEFRWE